MSASLTVTVFHNKQNCSSSSLYPSRSDTSKSCEIPYSKRRHDSESSKYDTNLLLKMLLLFFNMYLWTLILEKQFKNTFFPCGSRASVYRESLLGLEVNLTAFFQDCVICFTHTFTSCIKPHACTSTRQDCKRSVTGELFSWYSIGVIAATAVSKQLWLYYTMSTKVTFAIWKANYFRMIC